MNVEEFIKEANLGLMTWAFDRLLVAPVKWSWQSVMGGDNSESIKTGQFISLKVLKVSSSLCSLLQNNEMKIT